MFYMSFTYLPEFCFQLPIKQFRTCQKPSSLLEARDILGQNLCRGTNQHKWKYLWCYFARSLISYLLKVDTSCSIICSVEDEQRDHVCWKICWIYSRNQVAIVLHPETLTFPTLRKHFKHFYNKKSSLIGHSAACKTMLKFISTIVI